MRNSCCPAFGCHRVLKANVCSVNGVRYVCSVNGVRYVCSMNGVRYVCSVNGVRYVCSVNGMRYVCNVNGVRYVCSVNGVRYVCSVNGVRYVCSVNGVRYVCSVNGTPKNKIMSFDAHVAHVRSLLALENTKQNWARDLKRGAPLLAIQTPRRIAGRLFVGHLQPGGGAVLLCRLRAPFPCRLPLPSPSCLLPSSSAPGVHF
jgi:hypothetical protein